MNVAPVSTPPPGQGRGEYIQSVTTKGQVTIPIELRKMIGVQPNSQVIVSAQAGSVMITPVAMTLEEAFGSVQPISRPEDFKALRDMTMEEHEERVIRKMSTR